MSGPVALWAYGDESHRVLPDGSAVYLLAAAVVRQDRSQAQREELRSLLLRGQDRLHWHHEDHKRRTLITQAVAALPADHLVVIGTHCVLAKQERARRHVLQRLLWELDTRQVEHLLLESRHPERDGHDLAAIGGMRNAGILSRRLRVDHARPSDEVLLWLPDAVCGAVGDDLCGHPTHLHALKDRVEIIEIELT